MSIFHHTVIAATLFAVGIGGVANSARADVLNLPFSAALMDGSPPGATCNVGFAGVDGVTAAPGAICELAFPLSIPVGHTIQQIAIVHSSLGNTSVISAYLNEVDYSTHTYHTKFSWWTDLPVPGTEYALSPLMTQTRFGYPDAFAVQPNILYQVVVQLVDMASAEGVQITYQ